LQKECAVCDVKHKDQKQEHDKDGLKSSGVLDAGDIDPNGDEAKNDGYGLDLHLCKAGEEQQQKRPYSYEGKSAFECKGEPIRHADKRADPWSDTSVSKKIVAPSFWHCRGKFRCGQKGRYDKKGGDHVCDDHGRSRRCECDTRQHKQAGTDHCSC
jgi:hypothetical protein